MKVLFLCSMLLLLSGCAYMPYVWHDGGLFEEVGERAVEVILDMPEGSVEFPQEF